MNILIFEYKSTLVEQMELAPVLAELKSFVYDEHEASMQQLYELWSKPLQGKIAKGDTQIITSAEYVGKNSIAVTLGENESRFREGDMICLHLGDPSIERIYTQVFIEAENDGRWQLRVSEDREKFEAIQNGCFADLDNMDLRAFYDKALEEIAISKNGRNILLPLLGGELKTDIIYEHEFDEAAEYADSQGLNDKQSEAVGLGVASKYLACIQGPPGTGKTKVISIIAKLLVDEGCSVLMTSHTHMAINNALNKIAQEGVPVAKVCAESGVKSLDKQIPHFETGGNWHDRPDNGYVIGATPFATCSERLESFDFDTIIFDEASQITLPLALMAMRKGKRFIFVGDHKQLPPVILSRSILEDSSAFAKMVIGNPEVSVLLSQTYRMSSALTEWPSRRYYHGDLESKRPESLSKLFLPMPVRRFKEALSARHPAVFIKTPGINARNVNLKEAKLVADIVQSASEAGLKLEEIGIVTPFRSHAKSIKLCLIDNLGYKASKMVVTDTVERMQGQEREMIIVSLCSSDPQYIQAIAGFFFQAERLNVAVTRPQTKLIVIGPKVDESLAQYFEEDRVKASILDYCSLIQHCFGVECN